LTVTSSQPPATSGQPSAASSQRQLAAANPGPPRVDKAGSIQYDSLSFQQFAALSAAAPAARIE
jgi:hypothetical protein